MASQSEKHKPLEDIGRNGKGINECASVRVATAGKCEGPVVETRFGFMSNVEPNKCSLTRDSIDDESCSGSEADLISVGSFNSLSSRSSSDSGDAAYQHIPPFAPEGCFEGLHKEEEQEQAECTAKSQGKPPVAPKKPKHKASEGFCEQVVTPTYWSERQRELAIQGPLKCQAVTLSELLWWTGVRARSLFLIFLIFCAQYYLTTLLLLPGFLLQREHAALVYCAYALAYSLVFFRSPESQGKCAKPGYQKGFGSLMEEASVLHFGEMKIIRDTPEPFNPQGQYIFGYHPHGNLPAVLAWFPFTQAWRTLFPAIVPAGLVATAIFKVPVLRDLCLRAGIQEVSRKTFIKTLKDRAAVVLCPGGQVVLSARKTGFIRIAVESQAKLVPIFVFGESQLLDNLFEFPTAQKFTYKVLGFPIPFMPLGLFGFLPIPKTGPVTVVVGEPLDPKEILSASKTGTEAQDLERIRAAYYKEVQRLFEKYKGRLGFGDWELLLQSKS